MNAPVGLLGQKRPGHAVEDQPDSGEDREHHPHAANQDGVQTEAVSHAAGHAGDPALVGAHEARAAQGVEETTRRAVPGAGLGLPVGLVRGAGVGLRSVVRPLLGAVLGAAGLGTGSAGGIGRGGVGGRAVI